MKMTKHQLWRRVRLHCLECAGSSSGVCGCVITDCSLRPYRFGAIWAADRTSSGSNSDFSKKAIKKAIRSLCQYCLGQTYPKCRSSVCQLQAVFRRDVNLNGNASIPSTNPSRVKEGIKEQKRHVGNCIGQSK